MAGMILSAYSFIVLYFVLLGTELWLLAHSIGNRAEKLPAPIGWVLAAAILLLPALGALAIMSSPSELPENY